LWRNVKCQTYTHFLVEGRSSATAVDLTLFMLVRYFQENFEKLEGNATLPGSN
jgi:hypothetical protein